MKSKKKNVFLIGILVLFILNSIISLVKADKISTLAIKDSYVEEEFPDFNNGYWDPLEVGNSTFGLSEVYLHFNFSDKPTNWTKAEIQVAFVGLLPDVYYMDNPFNVTVSLIEESWDENVITWNNKPQYGEIITTFTVEFERFHLIDISEFISGRTEISVCLNGSDYNHFGGGLIFAREWSSPLDDHKLFCPYLIWTYTPTSTDTDSSTIHGFNLIIIFGVIAISGIAIILNVMRKSKKD